MNKPTKNSRSNVGPALHTQAKLAADAQLKANVLAVADVVFDRYVCGESFEVIARTLDFKVPGWKLRQILMESDETRETYANANILRSHFLIEDAIDRSREAAMMGDVAGLKVSIDTSLKVAGKLNAVYNDKASLELTGKDGKALEIKADLTLTAEQAYERLIKGE